MEPTPSQPDAAIDDRLERLEALVADQQATIERQNSRLEELAERSTTGTSSGGSSVPVTRRRALQAGGALALLGLGAGSVSAQPQPHGQVGTEDRPLNALYTIDLEATEITSETDIDADGTTAIEGRSTAALGETYGISGITDSESQDAYGVRGTATADSGSAIGVGGTTAGDTDGATGVKGHATADTVTAETKGVEGRTDADADNTGTPEIVPAGVEGRATGENTTHGVRGITESKTGRGVTGMVVSDDYDHDSFISSGIGVSGITDRSGEDEGVSDAGGVFGLATADSGTAYGVLGRNHSPEGWGVRGMDMSGAGHGVYSQGDSKTDGDHETTGDTVLGGTLAFADETPQRTAGPIAKGWINSDGTVENAVNVSSAEWNSTEERYRISIEHENYFYDQYVTVVTPLTNVNPRTTSNSSDLVVELLDDDGDTVQSGFQFVTFDLPSGEETTVMTSDSGDGDVTVTDGTDDEQASSAAVPTSDSHE